MLKAVKWSMVRLPKGADTVLDLFKTALAAGFDGITLTAPGKYDLAEVLDAQQKTGIPIHNINVANHWRVRLSDPDTAVRDAALRETMDALRYARAVGGSTILQVVGNAVDPANENAEQVWERSSAQLRRALPLAGELGVRIACENVGNGFCASIADWIQYLDSFESPLVGAFFDIGNHDRFDGGAPAWIRALGSRILKIDVKDHNHAARKNCALFEGDVDWPGVRAALHAVGYRGWATAEVPGGELEKLRLVAEGMDKALGKT